MRRDSDDQSYQRNRSRQPANGKMRHFTENNPYSTHSQSRRIKIHAAILVPHFSLACVRHRWDTGKGAMGGEDAQRLQSFLFSSEIFGMSLNVSNTLVLYYWGNYIKTYWMGYLKDTVITAGRAFPTDKLRTVLVFWPMKDWLFWQMFDYHMDINSFNTESTHLIDINK